MYFCKDENVYKPNNAQMLYSFCAELIDMLSDCICNDPEKFNGTIMGKFNGVYIPARKGETVTSLVDYYHGVCKAANKPLAQPELISADTVTTVKIQDILIQSGLEYWLIYNPKDKTYIIKFGKDLKLGEN